MTRKFFFFPLLLLALAAVCPSCDDDETYADMRKREDKQIKAFLNKGTQVKDDDSDNLLLDVPAPIKVITENEFYSNDSTTDVPQAATTLRPSSKWSCWPGRRRRCEAKVAK